MKKTVLLVDDDKGVRKFLRSLLTMEGLEVTECWVIKEALKQCKEQDFDLIMIDYNLTHGEIGWDIAETITNDPETYGSPKILLMSGTVTLRAVGLKGFTEQNSDVFLPKPFDLEELRSHLGKLLAR